MSPIHKSVFPESAEEGAPPFYVTSIGKNKNEANIKRATGYPHFHYLYTFSGKGVFIAGNQDYILGKNMGFLVYPNVPHEYYALEQPWSTHWMAFEGQAADSLCKSLGLKPFAIFYIPEPDSLNTILNNIYANCQSNDISLGLKASEQIHNFLLQLSQYKCEKNASYGALKQRRLEKAIAFIEANYQRNPSLKEIAAIVNVSPQYLCRIFAETLNMRPFEYITRIKIRKAKELLVEKYHMPVQEIAAAVGYNETSYFCAVFKKLEFLTPQQFRELYHNRA
ncbi:MAG: AraC family transcriptional regulator [Firmicutes bacterium]|nr:AraC family transcriptional regulator [Bacillota bacterium]